MKRALMTVLVLAATPVALSAQDPLSPMLDTVSVLWARGDAAALADYGAKAGIELEIQGEPIGLIAGRKLAAALRGVFANQETVSVIPGMSERVAGVDDRAFAELRWAFRPAGALSAERHTIFLGLVREEQRWRVSQIRILR